MRKGQPRWWFLVAVALAVTAGFSLVTTMTFAASRRAQDRVAEAIELKMAVQELSIALTGAHVHPSVQDGQLRLPTAEREAVIAAISDVARHGDDDVRYRVETTSSAYLREVDRQLAELRDGDVVDTGRDEARLAPLRTALLAEVAVVTDAAHSAADAASTRGTALSLAAVPLAAVAVALTTHRIARLRQDLLRRHEAFVERSSDLTLVTDERGQLRYLSPAAATALGASAESGVRDILSWVCKDDRPLVEAALRAAVAEQRRTERLDAKMTYDDGSVRILDVQVTNFSDDPRIGGLVWNCRDETERRALEDEIEYQSFHDVLTGLPNRPLFNDRLRLALARSGRHHGPLAVLLLDLDGFKAVNEGVGRSAGDVVLVETARRLSAIVRTGDTVARLGGDEFAVLLEHVPQESIAHEFSARLLEEMNRPFNIGEREVRLGVSVGLIFSSDGQDNPEVLVRDADIALYRAKERGRGCVVAFEPNMHEVAEQKLTLAVELAGAIDRGELAVHFQPTVNLRTAEITGFEALVRWHHPTRGLVPPSVFIPVAETNGEILQIGRWVLRQTCRYAAYWRSLPGFESLHSVCVNLSPRQLSDPALVDDVCSALSDTGLDPSMLVLEITETALAEEPEVAVARLQRLKRLGLRLAIDDFGTGYSSLSYLRRFPVDIIKIDRSFVHASTSTSGAALVQGIVDMATALGLNTVAEGIEDLDQAERMRTAGCTTGQGYLYARPVPADEIPKLVEALSPRSLSTRMR